MSRIATPGQILFLLLPLLVTSLLPRSREKVDLPDDFGPQTRRTGGFCGLSLSKSEIFLFHSAGDLRSCSRAFLGPSAELKRI